METIDEAVRELIKGGPLAILLGYVLLRLERSMNQLRDAVRELVDQKKQETKRISESH